MRLDERPRCFHNSLHEILCVVVICFAQVLSLAALGNILIPLLIIGPGVGIDNHAELPWTLSSYSLTVGIFIMVTGRLGDIYGHKFLFIIGYIIFAVFSAFTGLGAYVKNDIYFNIMRAFQGIGPATILPNGIALLARAYTPGNRKSFTFALFGLGAPVGYILGGLFGSLFAQFLWWPWGQWVLAFVCTGLAVGAHILIPSAISPPVHPEGKTDIIGAILGVSSLSLFIYSWNEGPVTGWDKPYVYVPLIVSVIVFVLFIIVEKKTKEPIMPLSIWSVKGFPGVLACIALAWSSFGIYAYYSVQFLQLIRGVSPLLTTAMTTPVILSGIVATTCVTLFYDRVPNHFLLIGSMLCFFIVNILIATMPAQQTYWAQMFVSTLIAPFGMDISFPAASLVVSNSMPTHQQGVAASMVQTVINWSISFGLGIAGTVTSELTKRGSTVLEGLRGGLYVGIGLSGAAVLVALIFCRVPSVSKNNEKMEQTDIEGVLSPEAVYTIVDTKVAPEETLKENTPVTQRF